jgi:hypothetical protein
MKYNITQRMGRAKVYISRCCHSDHHDPCITGSRMIAIQFDLLEASTLCDTLYANRWGKWEIEPVIEEPQPIVISLADPEWESRLTHTLGI